MTLCKKFGQTVEKLLGGGEEGGGGALPTPCQIGLKSLIGRLPRRMQIKLLRWRTWTKY